jgi:hypothetical protein
MGRQVEPFEGTTPTANSATAGVFGKAVDRLELVDVEPEVGLR